MFQHFIQNSDFAALVKLVSPDFFKVVPLPALLNIARDVLQTSSRWPGQLETYQELANQYCPEGIVARFGDSLVHRTQDHRSREEGHRILELYFRQILQSETWIMDLRSSRFIRPEGSPDLHWIPGPYALKLNPQFVQAVRNLYIGFYLKQPTPFDEALQYLGLQSARSILEDHFGLDDQKNIQFNLAEFERVFAKVFRSCADAGEKIAPEFSALGMILLTLYENLGSTPYTYDVRAHFMRAYEASQKGQTP
jgi:hypothetical protein